MSETSEGVPVPEELKKAQPPRLNEFGEIIADKPEAPKNPKPNVKSLDEIRARLALVSRQMNPQQLGRSSSESIPPANNRPGDTSRPK